METETISKIATALVRAKLHFKPIDVSLSDKSAHAPLEAILAAITVPLATEGLVILQPIRVRDDDRSILVTTILHDSGESIDSEMLLPVVADVQKFGAILIRYRCFSICSILAISGASEDVDLTPVVKPEDRQLEIKQMMTELSLTGSDINGILKGWFPDKATISALPAAEFTLFKLKLHETANLRQERMLAIG